ncbi:MAG: hypothetical protein ACK50J_31370, partial [Planctomyces sp.]
QQNLEWSLPSGIRKAGYPSRATEEYSSEHQSADGLVRRAEHLKRGSVHRWNSSVDVLSKIW